MPKDSPWFKHDQNARGDPDICDMRAKYKAEGYGWYWMLIEMMREQDDYMLSLSRCNAFALQMQCSTAKADAFIRDCISVFELFSTDGEKFWSDRLIRDMRDKDLKSEKAITAANTRWKNRPESGRNADAMPAQCGRNAIRKEENRREEKREESTADKPPSPTAKTTTEPEGFTTFWNCYPKKVEKQAALKEWKKLNPDEETQKAIIHGLSRAKLSEQWSDPKYIVAPCRFLSHRRWEDEWQTAKKSFENQRDYTTEHFDRLITREPFDLKDL